VVQHRNARLTPAGRLTLCQRIDSGRPVAHVAREMGISRPTAHKWWSRYCDFGENGLEDLPSRPLESPNQTDARTERQIENLRRNKKLGPLRIAARLNMAGSTVHKVLVRQGLNRLSWLDRPTGVRIRRYERERPGELVHVDIKKLGRIPRGGGHKVHGRGRHTPRGRLGYDYIHSAVDDHSRLAYSEVLSDEKGPTAAAFWKRAETWFRLHGVAVERVITDNGGCYRSKDFNDALGAVVHKYTRPYRPQTNGKVERFNRTLLEEWAYVRTYCTESARTRALAKFLHMYNHHRSHTALRGATPISRVKNVPGHYS
jgi:transposase InsO family protein